MCFCSYLKYWYIHMCRPSPFYDDLFSLCSGSCWRYPSYAQGVNPPSPPPRETRGVQMRRAVLMQWSITMDTWLAWKHPQTPVCGEGWPDAHMSDFIASLEPFRETKAPLRFQNDLSCTSWGALLTPTEAWRPGYNTTGLRHLILLPFIFNLYISNAILRSSVILGPGRITEQKHGTGSGQVRGRDTGWIHVTGTGQVGVGYRSGIGQRSGRGHPGEN